MSLIEEMSDEFIRAYHRGWFPKEKAQPWLAVGVFFAAVLLFYLYKCFGIGDKLSDHEEEQRELNRVILGGYWTPRGFALVNTKEIATRSRFQKVKDEYARRQGEIPAIAAEAYWRTYSRARKHRQEKAQRALEERQHTEQEKQAKFWSVYECHDPRDGLCHVGYVACKSNLGLWDEMDKAKGRGARCYELRDVQKFYSQAAADQFYREHCRELAKRLGPGALFHAGKCRPFAWRSA
jgi:hypothetical protein